MLQIKPVLSTLMRSKSGPILLLLQIILSVAIVANASFIINERLSLMGRESGVAEEEVFDFTVYNFDSEVDMTSQTGKDLEIIRRLPGVKSATTSSMTPLSGGGWSSSFTMGTNEEDAKSTPGAAVYLGNEQMLDTLGAKLIEGRNFYKEEVMYDLNNLDMKGIVSKAFADDVWPDESPLGKVLYYGDIGARPITIVGVVERLQGAWVNSNRLENAVIASVQLQEPFARFLVRADKSSIKALKEAIPSALHKDNLNRVVRGFTTISEHRKEVYRDHELMATLLSMMVVLLLLITSLGLAGMVMFNIQRRTKQIGTRRALGARKRDIVSFFLVENYLICLFGGLVGGLLAIWLGGQLMRLYSLPMLEWSYPVMTVVGLIGLTTLAVILPARKAANISPAIATRSV